ncbi:MULTISPECIES: ABC-type transport auxiliary lipoprotein family protein [unclassified Paracoccus (in: a-proteobacteria)]|uniref:ABC-type transport auxiliary lipoprotein family protein n=1 Tax=unclassified Paracoccus (in: a-proteobacteria) TaxID=2688777 RepID=UPI0012B245FC|nr:MULTISPECIES: ABC-type transport auxiliary lipoprotein family protein [unclassified Paracoccus (in: a-proteobacteria)]UXU75621.1 ABC-type transport auxiliary lipoprotein family protein [Paracoccus sp. SMMA_5]UXU81526.1 ABC-type transport auxiliary lipoprotein family protein [Paracoccus sp. SMMA_5_TC]
MRLTVTAAVLAALTLTLPGCAALKALEGEPERDVFELRPPSDTPRTCGRGRLAELVIEPPKARGTLDTDRIMIRPNALQTQYLPDARWGDTVPVTLQTLLVRAFGVYDSFTHVGRAPLGTAGDYALISEIQDFNAEVAGKGAVVKLTVDAQMVREMDAKVVARGRFAATAPAQTTRTADLVPAFDAAGQQLVGQMTDWGLRALGVNPARCR